MLVVDAALPVPATADLGPAAVTPDIVAVRRTTTDPATARGRAAAAGTDRDAATADRAAAETEPGRARTRSDGERPGEPADPALPDAGREDVDPGAEFPALAVVTDVGPVTASPVSATASADAATNAAPKPRVKAAPANQAPEDLTPQDAGNSLLDFLPMLER